MQSTYMLSPVRLTVCLSVRPSHRCVSQKRLKLGKCNFHHSVAQSGCVKQAWDEENKLFSSFLVYISKKEVAYALSIGNKVDDIGWPWTAISSNLLGILSYFAFLGGATTAKRTKITPIVSDGIVAHWKYLSTMYEGWSKSFEPGYFPLYFWVKKCHVL